MSQVPGKVSPRVLHPGNTGGAATEGDASSAGVPQGRAGVVGPELESESDMTETVADETILEALALIDRGLGEIQHRELMSTNEVADLLLDVRLLLAASGAPLDDAAAGVLAN